MPRFQSLKRSMGPGLRRGDGGGVIRHRNYALDLGVNAYFGKPFQEPVLLAAIAGLLGREMPTTQS